MALATAIPSAPGYLGTFELAFTTIGKALGLPSDEAFALGVIVHVEILVLTSVGGAIAFLRLGWSRSSHEVGEVARGLVDGGDLIDGEPDARPVARGGTRRADQVAMPPPSPRPTIATSVPRPTTIAAPRPTANAFGPTSRRSATWIDSPTAASPIRMHQPDAEPRIAASSGTDDADAAQDRHRHEPEDEDRDRLAQARRGVAGRFRRGAPTSRRSRRGAAP